MEKAQAIKLVRETFESSFERSRFIAFIRELFNGAYETAEINRVGNLIPNAFEQSISKYERIGKYTDSKDKRIDILIVHLKRDTSIERARSTQRNFVAGYLQGKYGTDSQKEAALVAFVSPDGSDWRFSLVKLEYTVDISGERAKIKDELTPAKRWSFLVGSHEKSHTAQRQFQPILRNDEDNPTLASLQEAFNIETVTKEFFLEYRRLFIQTKEALDKAVAADPKTRADFESKGIDTVNLAKKLLGQIIFLYYLQKKGWFGVPRGAKWGEGSRSFLRDLFKKKHGDYTNFFNDILEPLFYDALRNDRSHDDHFYNQFKCKIPFLNGGLFDPMNNYDWVNTDVLLSNELFSNDSLTKEGDKGDGILDIFDRYNFTVKEDEPFEKEVAIDPELLGKAYEKFNAIRPDNYAEFKAALTGGKKGEENKFNKQYGVYYTPREIVHYMCQQSLINYLYSELNPAVVHQSLSNDQLDMFGNATKSGQLDLSVEHHTQPEISKEDITIFIQHGELIRENEAQVENAGRETATYQYKMPETIRASEAIIDQKLASIKICDPAVGSGAFPVGMMSEIIKARESLRKNKGISPYTFKRECIENSLYGVDIDPGAVEIAKLRLWLSLIVDEDDIQIIKPLPNLDYKIVCGNSLVGFPDKGWGAGWGEGWASDFEKEIEALIHQHFNATNVATKNELKTRIDEKIGSRYKNSLKAFGYQINFDFRTIFSEVFQQKGGFDVVIANPPYITYHGRRRVLISQKELDYLKNNYVCAFEKKRDGKYNSAMFFIERFVKICGSKGLFCCITDISFYEHFYQGLKKYLIESTNVLNVVNGLSSFENVASGQLIIIASRSLSKESALKNAVRINNSGIQSKPILLKQSEWYKPENKYQFFIPENNLDGLFRKFEEQNKPLEFYFPNKLVRTGESVGTKEKGFVVDTPVSTPTVPIYEYLEGGKSVSERYSEPKPTRYFRFDINLLNERNDAYRNDAIKNKRKNPKVLGIGDRLAFDNPKVLIRQSSNYLCCTYTSKPYAYNRSYYTISNVNSSGKSAINMFYTLALLNSKLFTFYARKKRIIRMEQGKQPQIRLDDLKNIPIKMVKSDEQKPFINLVEHILAAKRANPAADTKDLEREIDLLVYDLYGLTQEEREIVEGQ